MNLYEIVKRGLILALLFGTVVLTWHIAAAVHTINSDFLPSLHQGLASLDQSAADLRKITGATQEYLNLQLTMLRSSREQKAIQAGIEAAAALKGTILLVNTKVVPKVMITLDSLNQTTQSLNTLVANTDHQVNTEVLPQVTATIKQVESSLVEVRAQTTAIGADIHSLTSSPDLLGAMDSLTDAAHELDLSMIHVEESTEHVAKALEQAPTVAKHIETITGNSSKVSKIASWGGIGVIVAKIWSLVF